MTETHLGAMRFNWSQTDGGRELPVRVPDPLPQTPDDYPRCPRMSDSYPPRIIGLGGQKSSGKNFVGSLICELDPAFQTSAFADRLKEVIADALQIPTWKMHDYDEKERLFPEPIIYNAKLHTDIEKAAGVEINNFILHDTQPLISIRHALQYIGTEVIRAVHPTYWVDSAMNAARDPHRPGRDTVFTDVRFVNEAQAIKRAGGVVVALVRDRKVNTLAEHLSEGLAYPVDAVFFAESGNFHKLRDVARAIITLVNGPHIA